MNDKKRFPDERPEDVQRVLDAHVETIEMIETLLKNMIVGRDDILTTVPPTIIKHVTPDSTGFVLKTAIKTIELLSGYITEELEPEVEALSGDLTDSYETNKEFDYENKRLKSENRYLRDDKFRVVIECTERDKEIKRLKTLLDTSIQNTDRWMTSYFSVCKLRDELHDECEELHKRVDHTQAVIQRQCKENYDLTIRLENSEKMLKAAVSKIDDLEYAKNKETKNSLYGICAKCVIRLNPVNNGSNFCGNCRYCVQLMTGEYACRIPIPDRIIDPDDSSCQYFKEPYDTRTDQEVCAECDKKDTEHCEKCPLFPF